MYIKIVCGKKSVLHFHELSWIFKTIFLFQKFFFLFSRHSGLPLHPNLMYTTCSTYIEEKWIQIFTYSIPTCGIVKKNYSDFFRQTIHQIQPVPPYNARGNHSVRKVQDHFSCKNFDDLFHANRHHNFKEQL